MNDWHLAHLDQLRGLVAERNALRRVLEEAEARELLRSA